MKIGDLVQYVDPATRAIPTSPMPFVLLGVILEMKVKKSMISKTSAVHALVQWSNSKSQCNWLTTDYLEVI